MTRIDAVAEIVQQAVTDPSSPFRILASENAVSLAMRTQRGFR